MSTQGSETVSIPQTLPLLPIRDVVIFPHMIIPLFIGRESSIKAVEEALNEDRFIFLATQKNMFEEAPTPESLYEVGTVGMIMRLRKLPDARLKILVQGITKARVKKFMTTDPFFKVNLEKMAEEPATNLTPDIITRMNEAKDLVSKVIQTGKVIPPDMSLILDEIQDPGRLADAVTASLGLKVPESQLLLETTDPIFRLNLVLEYLKRTLESHQFPPFSSEKDQKAPYEYFPSQKDPFGPFRGEYEGDPKADEIAELRMKLESKGLPTEVEQESFKQLQRLERMHPDASEASIIRTYIDWIIDIPWSEQSADNNDLKYAKQILDEDHYNLQEVKDRILEFLAVSKLKNTMRGPILCFAGPPGVGKTSLGKSIARCLGRKCTRVSLGGVRDEAEIRGHRRTYVGAMPGKVIQGLKQSGTNNPVFILDEIDKLGSDFRGDPSSALLEVLDPEQNHEFRDHYLNLPFNLQNTLFITTANVVDEIPHALRDRLEIIQIPGYTEHEKSEIAKRHLIKRQIKENGLLNANISFTTDAVKKIVREYTREAGLRTLERKIGSICRKIAKDLAMNPVEPLEQKKGSAIRLTPKRVEHYLGKPEYLDQELDNVSHVGLATGLAWTPFGGEILQIEAIKIPSKTGGLILTGQLGDVMKESARAAHSFIRSKADHFLINPMDFSKYEVHVHVPAGAIPKDGPSAGITIATSILSLFTNIPVRFDTAMTGEITLKGRVLMVGGVKEKALAAARQGMKHLVLPEENRRDISEIPEEIQKNMKFHMVKHIFDVFELVFESRPFKDKIETLSREAAA